MPEGIVPRDELTSVSPRVAREYSGKVERTITRDLNVLREMGLIVKTGKGFKANRGTILAWVPPRSV